MISSRYSGSDSLPSEQTQQVTTSFNNRRPTNNVRRQSRLLYAEKYGLNSPEWRNSTTFDTLEKGNNTARSSAAVTSTNAEDDDDDDRPLSLQPRSYSYSEAISSGRPRSIFNLSEHPSTTTRPTAFVKPITTTATGSPPCTVPSDMISIQQLYEHYHNKMYMEGFVFKRNKCNSDGTMCQDQWTKLYVELSGPVLSLWDGRKCNNNSATILPQYINISDATVALVNTTTTTTNTTTKNNDHSTMIILNTAGRNEYHIRPDPPTLSTAQKWIIAIRLSCFESARLYELFTRQLLLRPTNNYLWNASAKQQQQQRRRRMEGFIQARFAGDTGWKKYWVVASDQRDQKRLFGKAKSVPCRGQILFYESKKSKYPLVTLVNIVCAYTLYPSPQLIDMTTTFKVEGTTLTTTDIKTGEQNMAHASAGTLLMAPSAKEMMEWLVGIFDVFKLYGRPSLLLDDPLDPKALNFGETATTNGDAPLRLFLEPSDVMHLSIGQDDTLLDTKVALSRVLVEKLKNRSTDPPSVAPLGYTTKSRSNSAPLLSNITPPAEYTMNKHIYTTPMSNVTSSTSIATIPKQNTQPSKRSSMIMNPRRSYGPPMVYASDDSDEENDTVNNDSDDDLDDNHSDTLSEFIVTKGLSNFPPAEKKLQPSPAALATDSNKVLSSKDEHQDNNNTTDMMGFANDLLSRTFGSDFTNSSPTTATMGIDKRRPTIDTNVLPQSSPRNASVSLSLEDISPKQTITSKTATIIDSTTSQTSTSYNDKLSATKRMSVLPLPSDDEEDDDGGDGESKATEDDDDSPLHSHPPSNTLASSASLSGARPLSTILSDTTTPTTMASTRFSATTSSDGSSSNTSTSSQNQHQHHRKSKRQSMLSQQSSSNIRPASSLGLVHKIDTMQQQIQLQQRQQQLEKEQQSLWETGSLMGTDPRIASYQYRPNQQQQPQPQVPAWDTRSMMGSVTGPDPRIAMYRQAGSMYGCSSVGGSVYRGNDGGANDSVYSGGDDYQKTLMTPGQPLVQLESKPSEPRSGLVGVISQLEDEKRENENNNNNRFSTSFPLHQQHYQEQLLYQQHLMQQQQMMMSNPYMMNQLMMNQMMMNPMMMNPMMMNPMMVNPMMMQQQQQPLPQQPPPQQKSRSSMYYSGSFYNNQQPLMEEDNEDDDEAPLARPDGTPGNRRKSSGRF